MQYQSFQSLPITDLVELTLSPEIEKQIIYFPNGEIKPRHVEILEEIRYFASTITIYSFFYLSSGAKVRAYFLEPKSVSNSALIFFNRSGTGELGKIEHKTLFTNFFGLKTLLGQGYSLVISQLHGVDGGESMSDSCGPKDAKCLQDLHDILIQYSNINPDKIGMIGGSSGGLMTYQTARHFDWLKTGVVISSPVDEARSLMERGEDLKSAKSKHYDIQNKFELLYRSPIKWVGNISATIPLLIMHGTSDWRVDVTHSIDMAKNLYKANKPFRLKIYEGGDHSLREYQKEVIDDITNWFNDYLINDKNLPNLEKHGL
jgi:dipeptidyl aminopeptidase/acylaminoacyl peptidase